ncbi:MAG: YfcE family phosphodiesterase, partial [Nitrospinae bacterium]|nr:YfcE family phosphodiesterase [Nitrospinota bacterium]
AHFNRVKVDATLHLGDFVSPFALAPFARLHSPLHAVYGNNDGERQGLAATFARHGWRLAERPHELTLGRWKIAMLHEPGPVERYAARGDCRLIAYGHLHKPHEERRGETLIVSPGEGCGWITGVAQVAVVDLETGEVKFEILDI